MENCRFSVIVPTLHEEKAIERSLSSIDKSRKKSSHNVEMIVVDGGSKDNTVKIARKYTKKVVFPREQGIGRARNFGAAYAKGDVLIFLDADVVVPENFFYELNREFSVNGVCGASCKAMPHHEVNPSGFERSFYTMWHNARRLFYNIKPCGTGENGIIVSKDVFYKAGGFDESLGAIEDLDFVFRASKYGKFVYMKDLTIHETIRRFRKLGTPRFMVIYLSNFFHYLIFRNSRVKQWKPVR